MNNKLIKIKYSRITNLVIIHEITTIKYIKILKKNIFCCQKFENFIF